MGYLIGIVLACGLVLYLRIKPLLNRKRKLDKLRAERAKRKLNSKK